MRGWKLFYGDSCPYCARKREANNDRGIFSAMLYSKPVDSALLRRIGRFSIHTSISNMDFCIFCCWREETERARTFYKQGEITAKLMDYSRFEALRAERGITKKYIAEAISRTPTVCQDWKCGKSSPSDSQLEIIADILHTTVDYLQGYTDVKEKPTAGAVSFEDVVKAVKSMDREQLVKLAIIIAQEQGER